MASYPTSVKSFTTKSDGAGNKIFAAHVNDLQDEVTAIEDGLLNGTAPVNSSRITAPASQISNSSMSSLTVTAGSSFAVRPLMPPPEMALVFLQSTVAIGSSGASTLSWTGEQFVTTAAMHSTGSNPERLIPQTTGVYQFTVQVGFSLAGAGVRQVAIVDSSGANVGTVRLLDSTGAAHTIQATGYKRFDATGGYCVVTLALSGNSTLSLSSGITQTWFSMVKL